MAIITEQVGDIFSAPAHSVLIHACNTKGKWGAGVALAFKQKYPHAFRIYAAHCNPPKSALKSISIAKHQRDLAGTALLIPPSSSSTASSTASSTHWIACLFTSNAYGRARDSAAQILRNTQSAIEDLAGQLDALEKEEGVDDDDDNDNDDDDEQNNNKPTKKHPTSNRKEPPPKRTCYAVPLNSGNFGVPWRQTKVVLEGAGLDLVVLGTDSRTFL